VPLRDHVLGVLAASTGSTSDGGGSSLLSFLPFLFIIAIGYLLLVRPARTRQRKAMENRAQLDPGVEVVTTAGLIATVVSVDDDAVTLEVAPGVHSRFLKGAIARVVTPLEEPLEPAGPPEEQIPADTTDVDKPER
jgi:preprotein translocase subunit YajC